MNSSEWLRRKHKSAEGDHVLYARMAEERCLDRLLLTVRDLSTRRTWSMPENMPDDWLRGYEHARREVMDLLVVNVLRIRADIGKRKSQRKKT